MFHTMFLSLCWTPINWDNCFACCHKPRRPPSVIRPSSVLVSIQGPVWFATVRWVCCGLFVPTPDPPTPDLHASPALTSAFASRRRPLRVQTENHSGRRASLPNLVSWWDLFLPGRWGRLSRCVLMGFIPPGESRQTVTLRPDGVYSSRGDEADCHVASWWGLFLPGRRGRLSRCVLMGFIPPGETRQTVTLRPDGVYSSRGVEADCHAASWWGLFLPGRRGRLSRCVLMGFIPPGETRQTVTLRPDGVYSSRGDEADCHAASWWGLFLPGRRGRLSRCVLMGFIPPGETRQTVTLRPDGVYSSRGDEADCHAASWWGLFLPGRRGRLSRCVLMGFIPPGETRQTVSLRPDGVYSSRGDEADCHVASWWGLFLPGRRGRLSRCVLMGFIPPGETRQTVTLRPDGVYSSRGDEADCHAASWWDLFLPGRRGRLSRCVLMGFIPPGETRQTVTLRPDGVYSSRGDEADCHAASWWGLFLPGRRGRLSRCVLMGFIPPGETRQTVTLRPDGVYSSRGDEADCHVASWWGLFLPGRRGRLSRCVLMGFIPPGETRQTVTLRPDGVYSSRGDEADCHAASWWGLFLPGRRGRLSRCVLMGFIPPGETRQTVTPLSCIRLHSQTIVEPTQRPGHLLIICLFDWDKLVA